MSEDRTAAGEHPGLTDALDALDELVYVVDDAGRLRQWNRSVPEVTGYDDPELDGMTVGEMFPEPERGRVADAVETALEAGRAVVEAELRTADGDYVPYEFTGTRLTDAEGNVVGLAGIGREITERRAHERERDATITFLQDLYSLTTDPDLAFGTKLDRILLRGCAAIGLEYGFLTRIDRPDDDAEGTQTVVRSYGDHELLQPGASCPLSEAYCRKTIETADLLAIHDAVADGGAAEPAYDRFALGSYIGAKVLVDEDLYGTLCFASSEDHEPFTETDRTIVRLVAQWVSYELERQQSTAELRRQNERLDEFASIVSHDLRNPLTVASASVDMARAENDSEHLARAETAIDRMEALIDDLLTWAREGERASDLTAVSLREVVESCWAAVDTRAAELVVETDAVVRADESRLQQLFENLVRNSVEHAGSSVTVTVGKLEDGFYVEDDGPGVPPEQREKVFEAGYSTADDGTGFGLSIVQQICAAHGWDVRLIDGTDGGARFEVTGVTVE